MSATNRGTVRNDQDFYSTPKSAIDLILSRINSDLVLSSLEPCRADGRIYDCLPGARHWCEIRDGVDYLDPSNVFDVDLIVTNPPFSLALEFLRKSLSEAKTVIYLLRLDFLGTAKRKSFWDEFPPSHLYVLCNRPSFSVDRKTDMTEYGWFVWDRGNFMFDPPGIRILGTGKTEPYLDIFG